MTASLGLAILGIAFMPVSPQTFGQLLSSRCDATPGTLADCGFVTRSMAVENVLPGESILARVNPFNEAGVPSQNLQDKTPSDKDATLDPVIIAPAPELLAKEGFHWGPALQESFTFLAIEQAYVLKDDYRWVGSPRRLAHAGRLSDRRHL